MIFLTVGTSFPFNRLVQAVDAALSLSKENIEVFAQIGRGGYQPKNCEFVETLDKEQFDFYFNRAEAIISHAGMGTISMAVKLKKPILVMPRLKEYKEIVNNHQVIAAKRYEEMGYIISINNKTEILEKIKLLSVFKPRQRISQAEEVSKRISVFLHEKF